MVKLPGQATKASASGRPVMVLLDALGKRWTLRVIWELNRAGPCTFRDLRGRCDEVSPTSLNQRLKDLGELGLIARTPDGYTLTDYGRSLSKLLRPLDQWSAEWAEWLSEDRSENQ